MGSFDRPRASDDLEPSDRRGKPGGGAASDRPEGSGGADRPHNRRETEAQAAERLGLSSLNRSDYYDSQRAAADAQEAAIRRRDAKARDKTGESSESETERHAPSKADDALSKPGKPGVPLDQPERRLEEPRNYWTEVPRFFTMWQRLADRWPWRQQSDAHDAASIMSPEQRAAALDAVEKVPEREPSIMPRTGLALNARRPRPFSW